MPLPGGAWWNYVVFVYVILIIIIIMAMCGIIILVFTGCKTLVNGNEPRVNTLANIAKCTLS